MFTKKKVNPVNLREIPFGVNMFSIRLLVILVFSVGGIVGKYIYDLCLLEGYGTPKVGFSYSNELQRKTISLSQSVIGMFAYTCATLDFSTVDGSLLALWSRSVKIHCT